MRVVYERQKGHDGKFSLVKNDSDDLHIWRLLVAIKHGHDVPSTNLPIPIHTIQHLVKGMLFERGGVEGFYC